MIARYRGETVRIVAWNAARTKAKIATKAALGTETRAGGAAMSLSGIYLDLWRTAQETGQDAARDLHNGARMAVRVNGTVTTLTISRSKKPLGDVELRTFVRDCGVPETAVRFPQEGQNPREVAGVKWWSVTYRWREEASE